ncbi:MAG: hypothetical protein ABIR18_01455 [Chitinophagaceae bacterium]
MKESELKAINFKESLPIWYEDIEPFLMKGLNDLRDKLIELPDNSDEQTKLALFQEAVENFNALENNEELDSGIDTEEREGLCDALYKMGNIVGLDESTEYIDNWRDW